MSYIIIIGAGAIGRGYLPWVFKDQNYQYIFIDSNPKIILEMKNRREYLTYRVRNNKLEELRVPVTCAFLPEEFAIQKKFKDIAAVFINVGPRNVEKSVKLIVDLHCPIVLCENDPLTVDIVKRNSQLKNVFFAVPDVITSNSAPAELLEKDSLSVISEDGILFIDDQVTGLVGNFKTISTDELLNKQWTAKLYLHNTPHCISAYLGAYAGVKYVHEAMEIPAIDEIVQGSMEEMLSSLKLKWEISHEFLDWYAEKELIRFRNQLLFDPISRVAREPLRKLEIEGRLIGAAQICLSEGFIPQNILLGIGSALLFNNRSDSDLHLPFMRDSLSSTAFITHILGLRKGEALEKLMAQRLPHIFDSLEKIRGKARRIGL